MVEHEFNPELEELALRIKALEMLPFVESQDLTAYAGISSDGEYKTELEEVEVSRIISAPSMASWAAIDRRPEYILNMMKAIKSGSLDLKRKSPHLERYGDAYFVSSDGRHRCATAKLLGLDSIPANVTTPPPLTQVYSSSMEGYYELLDRREQGLWTGSLEVYPSRFTAEGIYVHGEIDTFEGVWVFSKDMDRVKKIYTDFDKS